MDVEDVYDSQEEQERLAAILEPRYLRTLTAVHELVASSFLEVSPEDFRLDDEATRVILDEAAERVVLIDRSTREALREQLKVGQERGYSNHQLAYGVPEDGYHGIEGLFRVTWKSRAETVARTELAQAQNVASLNRYAATGLVEEVEIVEHRDTDEPCASRNGKRVPLGDQPGLLHPNCRVGLIPVVEPS